MSVRFAPGVLVAGTYVVDRFLGRGASGEVWAATHVWTREPVALKVLAEEAAADEETAERFRREAIFLARAAGEHVARIVDFVSDPGAGMVLVMELVDGESLARVLDRRTLSVEEAVALGVDLLAGVAALHGAGVIHRDLKPGNVLLRVRPDGSTVPVLCDFGLSRLARGRPTDASDPSLTDLTRGDVAMGTLRYMAPEQVLNARQAT
ncbi:MAG: serine/threonine-protein kinase [Polyangiaceae bacterium]